MNQPSGIRSSLRLRNLERADLHLIEPWFEDPDNRGSRAALERAGFDIFTETPDFEGMLYYRLRAKSTAPRR